MILYFRYSERIFRLLNKMSLQNVKNNAARIKDTMEILKSELKTVNNEYNTLYLQQLKEENSRLSLAVEEAKKKLILLEVQNGVKQIPVPSRKLSSQETPPVAPDAVHKPTEEKHTVSKKPKEVKLKKAKELIIEPPVDIGRLDLRIAHIVHAERHPEADTLYLLKINCGEEKPRTVCSGLVKHLPVDKLQGRYVVLLCNLKPVKMRGILSEAMVMCACGETKIEVLIPPPGSVPGDLVECEGYTRNPDLIMNPKKKVFETVVPDLHTNDSLLACYKDKVLCVPGKGNIMAETLRNIQIR